MGIGNATEEYEKQTLSLLGLSYKGLKWCELGNQIRDKKEAAKKAYQSLGVEHISIDLNGLDGSLLLDLNKPMPFVFLSQFDVVTNYGTIEHINNQYQAFRNMHDMCKRDGIMLHTLPMEDYAYPEHCRYYYSEPFVRDLGNACNYQINNYNILKHCIAIAYTKKENNDFISKEEFEQVNGLIDTGDLRRTGDYTKADYNILISVVRKLPPPVKWLVRKVLLKK